MITRRGFLGTMLGAGVVLSAPRAPSLLSRLFAPKGSQVVPIAYQGETYLFSEVECLRMIAKRDLAEWMARRIDALMFASLTGQSA